MVSTGRTCCDDLRMVEEVRGWPTQEVRPRSMRDSHGVARAHGVVCWVGTNGIAGSMTVAGWLMTAAAPGGDTGRLMMPMGGGAPVHLWVGAR